MKVDWNDPFWQAVRKRIEADHAFAREMVCAIYRQVRNGTRRATWPTL